MFASMLRYQAVIEGTSGSYAYPHTYDAPVLQLGTPRQLRIPLT